MKRTWVIATAINIILINLILLFPATFHTLAVTKIDSLLVVQQQQLTSSTGPTINTITSDPSGAVTEPRGSLRIRTDTGQATVYQNTNAATAWFDLTAAFTSSTKGLAPASGGGTTNFLRADGTWTTPSGANAIPQVGTGIEGALTCFDGTTTCDGLVPSSNTYTLDHDLLATNITIGGSGIIVANGYGIFATGTCTVNGRFISNGANGTTGGAAAAGATGVGRFGVGGNGGNANGSSSGGSSGSAPNTYTSNNSTNLGGAARVGSGQPGGNGAPGNVPMRGGGSGGLFSQGGNGGTMTIQAATSNGSPDLTDLRRGRPLTQTVFSWGSGGGGADGNSIGIRGTGGGGGGMAYMTCKTLTGSGSIEAKGGNASNAAAGGAGGGGGGGGGIAIALYAQETGTVTVTTTGGNGGTGTTSGADIGGNGGSGAAGWAIAIDTSGATAGCVANGICSL